jgi:glycosyltransferase involved in cell wall biosynthesis
MEAASHGIPLIATDVGGSAETIDGNGILLPENPTEQEVAYAIRTVLESSVDETNQMRLRSLRIVEERFDLDKNKRQLLGVLAEVANAPKRGRGCDVVITT